MACSIEYSSAAKSETRPPFRQLVHIQHNSAFYSCPILQHRTAQCGAGCLVAAHEFYLGRPAAATARVASATATVLALPREAFHELMRTAPQVRLCVFVRVFLFPMA